MTLWQYASLYIGVFGIISMVGAATCKEDKPCNKSADRVFIENFLGFMLTWGIMFVLAAAPLYAFHVIQ